MAHLLGRLQEVRRESVRMEPSHHSNHPWLRTDVTWLHIDTTGGLGGSTVRILLRIPVDH